MQQFNEWWFLREPFHFHIEIHALSYLWGPKKKIDKVEGNLCLQKKKMTSILGAIHKRRRPIFPIL